MVTLAAGRPPHPPGAQGHAVGLPPGRRGPNKCEWTFEDFIAGHVDTGSGFRRSHAWKHAQGTVGQ